MKIITITGTKGKTTIARLLDFSLNSAGEKTLRVDSDGHFIDGRKKSGVADGYRLFGNQTPNVCPGKYFISMKKYFPDFTAILEASIGCSREGTGYEYHDIGVFTNVYNDHISRQKNRNSRKGLAKEKNFIFWKTAPEGSIVFNADDRNVCSELEKFAPNLGKRKIIPVGKNFKFFDIKKHLSKGGMAVSVGEGHFSVLLKNEEKKLLPIKEAKWIIDETFDPFLYNAMLALGCLVAFYGSEISAKALKHFSAFRFDPAGGRMVFLKSERGADVVFDYAHEKYSLVALAKLGRKLSRGRLIGILRVAPNNSDNEIASIAKSIGKHFDEIFVYDKLDGVNRGAYEGKNNGISRAVGETSKIFQKNLLSLSKKIKVTRSVTEEQAVINAAKSAKKEDLIIYIWGDSKKRSMRYLKEFLR